MNTEKPINEIISDFVADMDAKRYVQERTRYNISRFVKWMIVNRVDVRNPRRADVIHYKQSMIDEGKTPTTVNTYLSAVRRFFNWCEQNGIYSDIALGIKSPKDNRDFRKEYLKPEQVADLLDLIPTETITGSRDYAIVYLMLTYGLRRIEIQRLLVSDLVTVDDSYALTIQRKGRIYKETIKIEPEVYDVIERYMLHRNLANQQEPLFIVKGQTNRAISSVQLSKLIKYYLRKIKDSKMLTCHSLRHSAAINLLSTGKSLYEVQQMLGHKSSASTQRYLNAIESERRQNNTMPRQLIDLYQRAKKQGKTGLLIDALNNNR